MIYLAENFSPKAMGRILKDLHIPHRETNVTRAEVIFSVLQGLAPHISDLDEPPQDRAARLHLQAEHTAQATNGDRELEAALIVLADQETHSARWVFNGCKGDPPKGAGTCDGKTSRSVWQIKKAGCPKGWALRRGTIDAQREFAKCAARLWRASRTRCRHNPDGILAGAYSGYRSICVQPFALKRAYMHTSILAKLWQSCAGSESGKHCDKGHRS